MVWMGDRPKAESVDADEVGRADGVEGELVGDHRVVSPGLHLTARVPQRGSYSSERPCRVGIEGKGLKVGLGLLEDL
jgi:hypothetical protein